MSKACYIAFFQDGYGLKTDGGSQYVDLGNWTGDTCFVDVETCEQGLWHRFYLKFKLSVQIISNMIYTTRKRSLGQGNNFPGVCLSTGGVSLTETPLDRNNPEQRCPWTEIPADRDPADRDRPIR